MRRILLAIVLTGCILSPAQAENFTATVLTAADSIQTATVLPLAAIVQGGNIPVLGSTWPGAGIELQHPYFIAMNNILEDMQKLTIQAGADFRFPMQWRIAEMPEPFPGGQWPTAELRSAKSPAGVVLATYTITIISEALVKWSLDLSAAQTAALSGKLGFTEIKMPYAVGVYHMYVRIPTEVLPRVSQ